MKKIAPENSAGTDDPFADCILAQKVRNGNYPVRKYKGVGVPELTVDSAPAWSVFDDGAMNCSKGNDRISQT